MNFYNKTLLILTLLAISSYTSAQEFNLGLNFGLGEKKKKAYGIILEYKTDNGIGICSTPHVTKNNNYYLPLYLKYTIGNEVRISPQVGRYRQSNKKKGWVLGANIDILVGSTSYITIGYNYLSGKGETTIYSSNNGPAPPKYNYKQNWVTIGIKKNLIE